MKIPAPSNSEYEIFPLWTRVWGMPLYIKHIQHYSAPGVSTHFTIRSFFQQIKCCKLSKSKSYTRLGSLERQRSHTYTYHMLMTFLLTYDKRKPRHKIFTKKLEQLHIWTQVFTYMNASVYIYKCTYMHICKDVAVSKCLSKKHIWHWEFTQTSKHNGTTQWVLTVGVFIQVCAKGDIL